MNTEKNFSLCTIFNNNRYYVISIYKKMNDTESYLGLIKQFTVHSR